jgi:carbon-monoxide dehydrogenase small subunit
MLMTATDFLDSGEEATEAATRRALKGNICRCTGYENIVRAVRAAAGQSVPLPHGVDDGCESEQVAVTRITVGVEPVQTGYDFPNISDGDHEQS